MVPMSSPVRGHDREPSVIRMDGCDANGTHTGTRRADNARRVPIARRNDGSWGTAEA